MINRIGTWVLALAVFAAGMSWTAAVRADDDNVTLQGEVVDVACYMAKGSRGAAHKACAVLCSKRGVPMGLLTDSGELYLLLDDHNNPDPYEATKKLSGDKIEVNGKKVNKQGVASIIISSVKAL